MKLTEILHLCLVSKKSGTIHATTPTGEAILYLNNGEIVDARYADLSGEDAFYALSKEVDCECELKEEDIHVEKTIEHRTEYLLMEAARLIDESSKKPAQQAEHTDAAEEPPSRDIYDFELLYVTEADVVRHPVPEGRTTIGRARDCHIMLSNTTVSGHHAELINRNGTVVLSDLNSANGTYVNSLLIDRSQPIEVNDQVQVGACLFEFVEKGSSGTVTLSEKKTGMDLQDTRKLVIGTPKPGATSKPAVSEEFKTVQPVEGGSGESSGVPSAVWYLLIGLGIGAVLVFLIVILTNP
jgi:hypothetical protein